MFHNEKTVPVRVPSFFVPNEKINVYRKKPIDKRRILCYLRFNVKR